MTCEAVDLRRACVVIGVIAFHAAVLVLLLRSSSHPPETAQPVHETVVQLLDLRTKAPEGTRPQAQVPMFTPSPRASVPPSLPQNTIENGNVEGFHLFLFGCVPENLDKLTAEERAECAKHSGHEANEPGSALDLPLRALDGRHWQRALLRKQNPLLLPCANRAGLPLTLETVICVGNGALNGFGDLDEAPGYGDAPVLEPHVPNNGDPPGEPAHH